MPGTVTTKDNKATVMRRLEANIEAAVAAAGQEYVSATVRQMQSGYDRPIWRTGDLQRDVRAKVDAAGMSVTVGNTLEYAPFVHDGTSRMAGRAYLRDAVLSDATTARVKEVVAAYLEQGF